MARFAHVRHRSGRPLARPRELVVACPPLRSNVNFSRIVRAAGCCAVERVIACGTARTIEKIARDSFAPPSADKTQPSANDTLPRPPIEVHRTLGPVLMRLRESGYELVGLEQADASHDLPEFEFQRRTALVLGNEREGITPEILALLDRVAEIPVWGAPASHNVATAAAMALYEYCRQYPHG